LLDGSALDPLDFQIDVGGFSLTGSLSDVFKERMIRYRYARLRARDKVVSWIHHLVLNCVGAGGYPRRTLLAGLAGRSAKERKRVLYEYAPVEKGEEILVGLLERYWAGLREPLHFFPEISLPYAEACLAGKGFRAEALEQARRSWEDDRTEEGELSDLYYRLCFAKENPIDSAFEEVALEVLGPLLQSLIKQ
jgi:exodeoxyribonuclease V gamma subunit